MPRRIQAAQAAGKVSVAVFASRILGLVREQTLAALFGAGFYMDAWRVAFRIPNLLRDLFAEGALSSAFVPTFTGVLYRAGKSEAFLLANLVLNGLMVLLGALALLFALFSDAFVYLIAGGFAAVPGKVDVTADMLKILAPFLMTVAAASVAMGMLNTLNHYFLPALAPAFFNLGVIAAAFFLVPRFESQGWLGIYAVAAGALAGGFLQFAVQLPLLRRSGFRWRPRLNFRHEGVVKIARLIGPAVIGVSAVQINILVNTQLASLLGNGPVSWLSYAFQLIYLPIGLFGVAVGIVNLKEVSGFAAEEKWEELKETVANSIKLIALLAMPSAAGLMVLSVPIIQLIYERGKFAPQDTLNTAWALLFYSIGLFSYSCIKVYVPTFYALNDTRTPVRISILAVTVNVVLNSALVFLILPTGWEYVGLAFGTSVSVIFNNLLLARAFRLRLGDLARYRVASGLRKTALASLAMGAGVLALSAWLANAVGDAGLAPRLLRVSVCVAVGAGVYFLFCRWAGVEEVDLLTRRLRRRSP